MERKSQHVLLETPKQTNVRHEFSVLERLPTSFLACMRQLFQLNRTEKHSNNAEPPLFRMKNPKPGIRYHRDRRTDLESCNITALDRSQAV